MAFCKHRVMDKCKKDGRPCIFSEECFEPEEKKPMTNADRIRAMSDEELAAFLAKFDPHCCNCPVDTVCGGCSSTPPRDCAYWFEEWLQQPAEECE